MFQRFGQPKTHQPGRGDGDRQVSERFLRGAVGGDSIPGGGPLLAPLVLGETGIVEVLAGVGQTFPSLHDPDFLVGVIALDLGEFGTQMLESLLFGEPFSLCGIPFGRCRRSARVAFTSGEHVGRGCGKPLLKGGDRRPQPDKAAVAAVAGQSVLVVVARDDRIGPPRRGLRGQCLLTGI
ncbi:MAG TPA: hypothetical protein VNW93_13995 [Mycobacterium sp.]|nr:hypothetical protein [Mycobacterium sp.]